jgi:hypothetical protein
LVLVIVGEKYGADREVGVTDGRIIRVMVGADVPASVMMMRIVIVGVEVADGRKAVGGSSKIIVEVGVYLPPGRKGVFEGGRKALRSLAEACFHAPGIDPVVREQPKTSSAAAGQNILKIPPAFFIIFFQGASDPFLSMTIIIRKGTTKITFSAIR